MKKYQIIYADPPWDYKGGKQHNGKGGKDTGGAINHYSTMKLSELKKLPISNIVDPDGTLLFMWCTNPHLDQGIDLMKAWGFKYTTVGFVWNKGVTNPGFYTMSQCELCLIGKFNKIPKPRGARNVRQYFFHKREAHSKKPEGIRSEIDKMFPSQNKIELFARQKVYGWDSWGNQVQCDISF
jgi:N6-adenosine-specific RNA methylase IME4|tara:strand:+ start:12264 stop:12809 length:546 start_codon:yes stop_codon:yes gene_type:complete